MAAEKKEVTKSEVKFRKPTIKDGKHLWRLVQECPPLDVNSCYAYLLLGAHFSETTVVAELDGKVVGMVSGYRPPGFDDVVFVWQVAVHESAQGHGVARGMLEELLLRDACKDVKFMDTTVSPSNEPSRRMFYSLARHMKTDIEEKTMFTSEDFGEASHEEEILFHIGPFK